MNVQWSSIPRIEDVVISLNPHQQDELKQPSDPTFEPFDFHYALFIS